jgi:RNA polymerase sigma-70 factor (ECF subfamily)
MTENEKQKLEETFKSVREDLKRLAKARLDRRLNGRVDSSDIIQDTYHEAYRRYTEFLANPEVSLTEWLRFLTIQKVTEAHRFHLGRQKRTVRREIVGASESQSILCLVEMIASSITTPHSAAVKAELHDAVSKFLESMSEVDQEIIRMRHDAMLSNDECAEELGISTSAASKRYIRALQRLRSLAFEYVK